MLLTLLTDFGDADGYGGAVKGVLHAGAPGVVVVDLAHAVAPGDVLGAAFAWSTATATFPPGAVHLAVVDPGVGTARRGVACATSRGCFVAPDNGLLTGVLGGTLAGDAPADVLEVAALESAAHRRMPTSATFQGRDVFAPAAAFLAAGGALRELGPAVDPATLLRLPSYHATRTPEGAQGQVLVVDRFGNLRTNLPTSWMAAGDTLRLGDGSPLATGVVHRTFGDVAPGELVVYGGSAGSVEVAVRDGSAAARLGVAAGSPVRLVRVTAT